MNVCGCTWNQRTKKHRNFLSFQ